jgi:hypothetical protein
MHSFFAFTWYTVVEKKNGGLQSRAIHTENGYYSCSLLLLVSTQGVILSLVKKYYYLFRVAVLDYFMHQVALGPPSLWILLEHGGQEMSVVVTKNAKFQM